MRSWAIMGKPLQKVQEIVLNAGGSLCHCHYKDEANILHGIRGGWTMRSEIMNAHICSGKLLAKERKQ